MKMDENRNLFDRRDKNETTSYSLLFVPFAASHDRQRISRLRMVLAKVG
jgi:hypothetical protein